jgi:hypothetical protein
MKLLAALWFTKTDVKNVWIVLLSVPFHLQMHSVMLSGLYTMDRFGNERGNLIHTINEKNDRNREIYSARQCTGRI